MIEGGRIYKGRKVRGKATKEGRKDEGKDH